MAKLRFSYVCKAGKPPMKDEEAKKQLNSKANKMSNSRNNKYIMPLTELIPVGNDSWLCAGSASTGTVTNPEEGSGSQPDPGRGGRGGKAKEQNGSYEAFSLWEEDEWW